MSLTTVMNGKPTGPQVQKLLDHVKLTKAGDIITYETIESLWGEARKSTRFRTLIGTAKRRILRELGLDLHAVAGVGYEHPAGWTQIRQGVARVRRGTKSIVRGVQVSAVVSDDRLPEPKHRAARDFIVSKARYLAEVAKAEKKSIQLVIGRPEVLPSLN